MATCSSTCASSIFCQINIKNCSELGLNLFIWDIYIKEKAFQTKWCIYVSLSFLDSDISKILTFSYTLLSVGDLPERLLSFLHTTAVPGKYSIYKISQKIPLKSWKFQAC